MAAFRFRGVSRHSWAFVVASGVAAVAVVSAGAAITPVTNDATGAAALVAALNTSGGSTVAAFDPVPSGGSPHGVADSALTELPTSGSTFAILTTGDAGLADDANSAGNSGANLNGASVRGNTDFDVTVLKVQLTVPQAANCLTFDFKFLSEEFPEYVNTDFNDAFIAELDSSTWTTSGSTITAPNNFAYDPSNQVISINSTGNTAMSAANATGTTYDGATPLLSAAKQVAPGPHTLYLSIFDQGDRIYDSAVFVDNLRIGFVPSPATQCVSGAVPKTFQLDLAPVTSENPVGTQHTVTATLTEDAVPSANRTISFSVQGANTASGTATTNASGQATFTYTGTSGGIDTITACFDATADNLCNTGDAIASVTKTWVVSNDPPVAVDDTLTTNENTAGSTNVLGNDSDPDADPLTVAGNTQGAHGSVSCTPAGLCTYTPNPGYSGPDSFDYTISDGHGGTDTGTVTVTVIPANAPPSCAGVAANTRVLWPPNNKLVLVTLGGASDPDGDPVVVTITGVSQNEPVGEDGPDAKLGPQTDKVWLRAQRDGEGAGRVYVVAYTAVDGQGGSCAGTALVVVPHDQDDAHGDLAGWAADVVANTPSAGWHDSLLAG